MMAGPPTLTEWQGSPMRVVPKKLVLTPHVGPWGEIGKTRRTVRRYFEVSGFGHLDRKNPTWGFLNPDLVSVTPILAPRRTNSGAVRRRTEWQGRRP